MDRGNFRSLLSKVGLSSPSRFAGATPADAAARRSPRSLLAGVGRALGVDAATSRPLASLDSLEERNLLEGSFATAIVVNLSGTTGRGTGTGTINPATPSTDNDYFKFTAPSADFVSILADTANETPASNLNTRITVYGSADFTDVVASGTTNGTLTSGVARDGWAGFMAQAGREYFVVVSSEGAAPGTYTLRVNAQSTLFDIGDEAPAEAGIGREAGSPVPDLSTGLPPITPIMGVLLRRQDEIVYKYVVPNRDNYDSLVSVNAQSTQTNLTRRLDTRIDIYDAQGVAIATGVDSDSGRFNDAFTTIKAVPGATYYIRVRSDEIRNANQDLTRGVFYLVLDGAAEAADLNPVTRQASRPSEAFIGFGDPSAPPPNPFTATPAPTFQTATYTFTAMGDETAFITATPTGLAPVNDPALRIFDDQGNFIRLNDDYIGTSAELQLQLVGGRKYFIVVDGFEGNSLVQYTFDIEANHTFDNQEVIDDHPSTPANGFNRRVFQDATALVFNQPFFISDADQNPLRDRGQVIAASGSGRIWGQGDTDLFQFTLPVDMLTTYAGNNDDQGTSLYFGGAFDTADPNTSFPVGNAALGVWDAQDYWYTGAQYFDANFNVKYGFNDNPATAGTDSPEIYALFDWNPTTGTGTSDPLDRILVVGGDFDLIIPTPFGPATFRNLAMWAYDRQAGRWVWSDLGQGSADGPIRAITTYDPVSFDPDGAEPAPTTPDPGDRELYVGGDFTDIGGFIDGAGNYLPGTAANHLASLNPDTGAWTQTGAGVNGRVNALTVYDPPDPGAGRPAVPDDPNTPANEFLDRVRDAPDMPSSLIIGGLFANTGPAPLAVSNNLATWNGVNIGTLQVNSPDRQAIPGGTNGEVFALAVYDDSDPDGDTDYPSREAAQVLVVGGNFSNAGDLTNVGNVVKFGRPNWDPSEPNGPPDTTPDPTDPSRLEYNPILRWEVMDEQSPQATNGPVFALQVWDPPNINLERPERPPVVVIGGSFDTLGGLPVGNIGEYGPAPHAQGADDGPGVLANNYFGLGAVDGAVRALTVVVDAQEPGIAEDLRSGTPQEALYVGGDFTVVRLSPLAAPIPAAHVAQFSAFHNVPFNVDFFNWSAMSNGVDYTADPPPALPATVFVLAAFDDGNPAEWDRHDRRQTRIDLTVSPASGSFINAFVRIYDSSGAVVYQNDTKSPPFPDPAGSIDGSLVAGFNNQALEGPALWGGETYYIEVSDVNGSGTGRYNIVLQADALPTNGGGGTLNDINSTITEEGTQGNFAAAAKIDTNFTTGDATNIVGTENQPLHGNNTRSGRVRPSTGQAIAEAGDMGNVSTIGDTDLYYFRAETDGFAEIRLATLGLPDVFSELLPDFTTISKTVSSNLDGALRIFDNDFTQIGYWDDNPASSGEFQNDIVGTLGASFLRRDPRAVIPVEAGKTYYVQVESGLLYSDGTSADPAQRVVNIPREIDWRHATGSYVLVVNDMPLTIRDIENNAEVIDDHTNFVPQIDANLSTPIPIGDDGIGALNGVINNTPFNPFDDDWSTFFAPASGVVTITLTPLSSELIANLQVGRFNQATGQLELVINGSGSGRPGDVVSGSFSARSGEQFHILVNGFSNTEGQYRIDIATASAVDDQISEPKLANAGDIILRDFLGSGSADGRLEGPGDTDIFRFRAETFGTYTVTVEGIDATMRPAVTVYEVSEDNAIESGLASDDPNNPDDPSNNPILLRVGVNNNDPAAATRSVQTRLPVTPDRIAPATPPGSQREYPYYYVVVRGLDPNADMGSYRVTVSFTATDDHADCDTDADGLPDTGEYQYATPIVLDTTTGLGTDVGIVETNADSDLFKFTAPTNGDASVLISRPTGSLIRPKVTILDADANVIAQAIGDDSTLFYQANVSFTAVRGTTYYVCVEGYNDPQNPNTVTQDFGAYTLSVNTPPLDDYPNIDEYTLADTQAVIVLSGSTGAGQIGGNVVGDGITNPRIQPTNDTDLFTFTTIRAGSQTISVLPFDTSTGRLAPRLSVIDAAGNVLQTVSATLPLQEQQITITNALAGVKYYVLVQATVGVAGSTLTGEYRVKVQGPVNGGGGGGGGGSDIDFNNPSSLPLALRTGDGCVDDTIDVAGDRDLYTFTTGAAAGRVFVQIITPEGSLLDASVRILNAPNENAGSTVAFDSDGIPGVTAYTSFAGQANTQYWIIIDGLGDSVGSYQLCINTRPTNNVLYFPEGFASDTIREFISIVNPNTTTANYTVTLRYETGDLETVITSGSVSPGSRGGTTIIDGSIYQSPGIRKNTPYSVIIESDQPLGATLAHYDFGNAIGDSFTERVSSSWNFARVQRTPGGVMDFIVFYNPSPFSVNVTLTAYQTDKAAVSSTQTVGALRRGGFSITDMPELPLGVFSVVLTATATNPSNQPAFEGIVASLSHYSADGSAGFGLLGDPDGGYKSGAVTNLLQGQFSRSEAVLFNPGNTTATVTVTGSYMRANLPEFSRTFDIRAGGQMVLTSADFGLVADQPVGLRYTSNLPISVMSDVVQNGDADASTAAGVAGTRFLFGDAFMDPALAGSKFFETLYLYNPTALTANITVKLSFTDGTSASFLVNIAARRFAEVKLHERPELTSRPGPTWFSMELSTGTASGGGTPFMVTLTHYDLLLGGGWATTPVPVGFVNSIARIPL